MKTIVFLTQQHLNSGRDPVFQELSSHLWLNSNQNYLAGGLRFGRSTLDLSAILDSPFPLPRSLAHVHARRNFDI